MKTRENTIQKLIMEKWRLLLVLPNDNKVSQSTAEVQTNLGDCVGELFVLTYINNSNQITCASSTGWIENTEKTNENLNVYSEPVSLVDTLHEAADGLPYAGVPLCVVFGIQDLCLGYDGFLRLAGALRRLKDWHNANISVVQTSSGTVLKPQIPDSVGDGTMEVDQDPVAMDICTLLQSVIGVSVFQGYNDVRVSGDVFWQGKCALVDKTVNRGFILPGFQLQTKKGSSLIKYPGKYHQNEGVVLGRMLEVLDEVTIATVPNYLLTGSRFKLSLFSQHPHSQAFTEQLLSQKTGLLTRLACYPQSSGVPTCGEKYLGTSVWKESVLADITYVQEPEEEFQDPHDFLYFLMTADRGNSDWVTAHLLKSSSQFNGQAIVNLHWQSLVPRKTGGLSQDDMAAQMSSLPCLNSDTFDWLIQTVSDIQSQALKDWLDQKRKQGVAVSKGEVQKFLCHIRELVLKKLQPCFPKEFQTAVSVPETSDYPSELDLNPSDWPERQFLLHQECQRKGLSRVQSTESLALSSPPQAEEDIPTTIDIKNFTLLFKEDGSAASDNLSPIRSRLPSRTRGSLCSLSTKTDTPSISWPECRDLRAPDVYYNRDRRCERIADQCSKLQDRYVKKETYSSCSSPIFFVKKTENKQPQTEDPSLRCSPRKSMPRFTSPRGKGGLKRLEGKLKSPRKSTGSMLKSPKYSAGSTLKSPRKSLSGALKSPLKKMATQLKSPRRSYDPYSRRGTAGASRESINISPRTVPPEGSTSMAELRRSPRKKVSAQFANVMQSQKRRQSLPSMGVSSDDKPSTRRLSSIDHGEGKRKESRSERHKRRLEEIVTDVLIQHGVSKEDTIHTPCVQRLYKVTKLFVMDLPTSQNLKQEMRNIAEGQVKQVVDLEKKRHNVK